MNVLLYVCSQSEARFEATQCEQVRRACVHVCMYYCMYAHAECVQVREEALEHASERDAAESRERDASTALANAREEAAKELAAQREMLMQELRRADTEISAKWEGVYMYVLLCVYVCIAMCVCMYCC
jgi:hypothetical protein